MDAQITFPEEFRRLVDDQPGQPVQCQDAKTKQVYFVYAQNHNEAWLDAQINEGLDALERGEVDEWDIESMLAALHKKAKQLSK